LFDFKLAIGFQISAFIEKQGRLPGQTSLLLAVGHPFYCRPDKGGDQ
jgi:hypothetical protein